MSGASIAASVVLYVFFSLLLSIIAYELNRHLKLPVRPMLILLGLSLQLLSPYLNQLHTSTSMIYSVSEPTIKFLVFPLLIFKATFFINWYTFKKELIQILILSTSAVVVNTFIIAASFKYMLNYSFDWNKSLMIGVVLSATDHIAVSFALKRISVSERLATLMNSESLMNEATILVIFQLLVDNSNSVLGITEKISHLVQLFFGGVAMGLAFALGSRVMLKRILNDFLLELDTCIVTAFLLFWTCENVGFSGPVATAAYGLYLSAYGRTLISPNVIDSIRAFLLICTRNIESLALITAGIILSNSTIRVSNKLLTFDYILVIIVTPLCYLIRSLTLIIHFPILKVTGYGLHWKEFAALIFSGIKGTISTSLVVIIVSQDSIDDDYFKALIIYIGIGNAVVSLLTGGKFLKLCVKLIKIEDIDNVEENMLLGVTKALVEASQEKIEELHREKELGLVKWDEVLKISGADYLVRSALAINKIGANLLKESSDYSTKEMLKVFASKLRFSRSALKVEMRRRYLSSLKGIYCSLFDEGMCHSDAFIILVNSCNILLENDKHSMADWKIVESMVYSPLKIKIYSKLSKYPIIGRIFRKLLYKCILIAYDTSQTFIKGHEETEELIEKMEIDIDKAIFSEILSEAERQISESHEFLSTYILDCFPEVLAEVQTKRTCKTLLFSQKELVEEIYEHGVIKEIEYEALIESIEASIRTVTFQGLPSMPILRDILTNRFPAADPAEISALIRKITEIRCEPDQILFNEGEESTGAYLIIRGRINESSTWINQELIIGNIVGVQYLIEEYSSNYLSTATSITSSLLAHIPKEIFAIEGLVEDLYKEAAEEIICLNKNRYKLNEANEKYLLRVVAASTVVRYRKGKKAQFIEGAFVLKGRVYEKQKEYFIKPSVKSREIYEDCIVLMLPRDFSICYHNAKSIADAIQSFCVKNTVKPTLTKDPTRDDLVNLTESRIEDTEVFMKSESKPKLNFKRRSIVPVRD